MAEKTDLDKKYETAEDILKMRQEENMEQQELNESISGLVSQFFILFSKQIEREMSEEALEISSRTLINLLNAHHVINLTKEK
uniref:Uncharacterized protein n=2 Tax=viral metagenome TaxID=1070528 RepID=A0A6M3KF80_9ZZZZ